MKEDAVYLRHILDAIDKIDSYMPPKIITTIIRDNELGNEGLSPLFQKL